MIWSVVLRRSERQDESSRWAKHAVVVAFAAANGYVALAIGSLALSPWADGSGAAKVLFFLACGVYATGALALYPYVLWRSRPCRAHAAATVVAVAVGLLATAVVAFMA